MEWLGNISMNCSRDPSVRMFKRNDMVDFASPRLGLKITCQGCELKRFLRSETKKERT